MSSKNEELLVKGIEMELDDLTSMNLSIDEKVDTIDNVVKLYRLYNDEKKLSQGAEINEKQLMQETKLGYIRLGVETAGIILPLIFYAYWMKKGFEFEKTGAITSGTFSGLIKHFRPTKK